MINENRALGFQAATSPQARQPESWRRTGQDGGKLLMRICERDLRTIKSRGRDKIAVDSATDEDPVKHES